MKEKLQSPVFIIAVLLLLINDFYLKSAFGNVVTGKLSDFAGLFAFPFFFSCLFPKYRKPIHIVSGLLFIWWKSTYAGFFIDSVNLIGIPISRTVDFGDNIALISILGSYLIFNMDINYRKIRPLLTWCIAGVSIFSFIATSMPPPTAEAYTQVNKVYTFQKPIDEFVADFNALQQKELKLLDKYKIDYQFNPDDGTYIYPKTGDTLIYLVKLKENRKDTIHVNSYFADYIIYENPDNSTVLELKNISNISYHTGLLGKIFPGTDESAKLGRFQTKSAYIDNTKNIPIDENNEGQQDSVLNNNKLIKEFEKRIVKRLKK